MLLQIATLTLLIICEVKSDFVSENRWRDMKNGSINDVAEYCKKKNCLVKCCPDGHIIIRKIHTNFVCYPIRVDYSKYNKYIAWDASLRKSNVSYFHFIQNDQLADLNKNLNPYVNTPFELLKNGSMKLTEIGLIHKFRYCVDFFMSRRKSQPKLIFKVEIDRDNIISAVLVAKVMFTVAGMLISTFFMVLVLVVYALLPNLQNIGGKVLMAYLLTLSIAYTIRAAQMIFIIYSSDDSFSCFDSSPAYYFFILASFFWLNIMSLDLWRTLRGQTNSRNIHRHGEHVKFFWYSAYAWGTPLLITMLVFIVEKQKLYNDIFRPPFEYCFGDEFSTELYLHLPIGIMSFGNFIFFAMTVYNIWLIKRSVVNNKDSRNTKRHQNRFAIYIKLFILTGVFYVFQLFLKVNWVEVVVFNFITVFSEFSVFYMFVCKKKIILMLCKRFNIQNGFVDRLRPSNQS